MNICWLNAKKDHEEVQVLAATNILPKKNCFYFQLADDAPEEDFATATDEDTTYDSAYHDRETDYCKDSGDDEDDDTEEDDGNDSETYAVSVGSQDSYERVDIIEYDVASSTDDDFRDNDSVFSATSDESVDICVQIQYKYPTDGYDSEIELWADTEASSDTDLDPELSPKDYWKCVKCNNDKNNPLYRFCEKCYQLRKSHFPPRPKGRKNKPRHRNLLKNVVEIPEEPDMETEEEEEEELVQDSQDNDGRRSVNGNENLYLVDNSHHTVQLQSCSLKRKHRENDSAGESPQSSDSGCDNVAENHQPVAKKFRSVSPEREAAASIVVDTATLTTTTAECFVVTEYLRNMGSCSSKDSGFSSGGSQESNISASCYSQEIYCDEDRLKEIAAIARLKPNKSEPCLRSTVARYYEQDTELCSICTVSRKNAVFVHTLKACSGACYVCALKTWKRYKTCPFCKEKPKNVMKLFNH